MEIHASRKPAFQRRPTGDVHPHFSRSLAEASESAPSSERRGQARGGWKMLSRTSFGCRSSDDELASFPDGGRSGAGSCTANAPPTPWPGQQTQAQAGPQGMPSGHGSGHRDPSEWPALPTTTDASPTIAETKLATKHRRTKRAKRRRIMHRSFAESVMRVKRTAARAALAGSVNSCRG